MRIKYTPTHPDRVRTMQTNLGEFVPGEVADVPDDHRLEAERLIACGDFIETDEPVNHQAARAHFFESRSLPDLYESVSNHARDEINRERAIVAREMSKKVRRSKSASRDL